MSEFNIEEAVDDFQGFLWVSLKFTDAEREELRQKFRAAVLAGREEALAVIDGFASLARSSGDHRSAACAGAIKNAVEGLMKP